MFGAKTAKKIVKKNSNFFIMFCMFGLTAVMVEYVSYAVLLFKVHIQLDIAKYAASFIGLAVSYFLNSTFNFGRHYKKSVKGLARYILLYIVLNALNTLINRLAYNEFHNINTAFLIAMTCSTFINYNAIKRIIFKKK